MASPAFASSSSGRSAAKSYMTTPYTMAPEDLFIFDMRGPSAGACVVGPDVSEYPES